MYSLRARNLFPQRSFFLGQAAPAPAPAPAAPAPAPAAPVAPGAVIPKAPPLPPTAKPSDLLNKIRDLAKEIREYRARLAEAFQKFTQTGDQSWNQKFHEYDQKVLELVNQAKAMVPSLSPVEQPIAMDLIAGNFNPKKGSLLGQTATPAPAPAPAAAAAPAPIPATPTAAVPAPAAATAPAPGVVCQPTAEGGQVCSNGTCTAPGANAPVTAAEAPMSPVIPIAIGAGATAVIGVIWYLIATRK